MRLLLLEHAERKLKRNNFAIIINKNYKSNQEASTKAVENNDHQGHGNQLLAKSIRKSQQDQTSCEEKTESLDHCEESIGVEEVDKLLKKWTMHQEKHKEKNQAKQDSRRKLAETLKMALNEARRVTDMDLEAHNFSKKQERKMKLELKKLKNETSNAKEQTRIKKESKLKSKDVVATLQEKQTNKRRPSNKEKEQQRAHEIRQMKQSETQKENDKKQERQCMMNKYEKLAENNIGKIIKAQNPG